MTDIPDWASEELQRAWAELSEEDRRVIIDNRDADLLRGAASQLRGSELDRSDQGGDFTLDGLRDDGYQWHAAVFGTPWNGWATPIVTRQTLQNLISDLAELDGAAVGEIRADGLAVLFTSDPEEDDHVVEPDAGGLYHLHVLGWTFLQCE